MKVMITPSVIGSIGTITKGLIQGDEDLEIKRDGGGGRDCPNYTIVQIGQNTEKSSGDLRRLAVTQTPVENH